MRAIEIRRVERIARLEGELTFVRARLEELAFGSDHANQRRGGDRVAHLRERIDILETKLGRLRNGAS